MAALRVSDQRQAEKFAGIDRKPKQDRSRKSGHKHSLFIQDVSNQWSESRIILANARATRGHFTGHLAEWYEDNVGGNEMKIVVAALDNLVAVLRRNNHA